MSSLLQYSGNINSQNGEDGVLIEMFRRLRITPQWVCEFGAWDGKHLSNTFHWVKMGAHAVYIEADEEKIKDLHKTCEIYKNIIPIHSLVEADGENSLDSILATTPIPYDFDILSIDIDSYDYQVWKGFRNYMPKVVVIEINSSIPPYVIEHIHDETHQGTGFLPMLRLGLEKQYTLAAHTGNLIFIRNDLYHHLNMPPTDPFSMFLPRWWMK